MNAAAPRHWGRLTLYRKFLLVLLPVFTVLAAGGLLLAGRLDAHAATEALALRVGNLAGRVAGALDRQQAVDNAGLARDFLATFGNDPAVLCAELNLADPGAAPVASYPPGVGCRHVEPHTVLSLALDGSQAMLVIHYTDAEIERQVQTRSAVLLAIMVAALGATLVSASIGFKLIVGRRMALLCDAIAASSEHRRRTEVQAGGQDELGDVIRAYNLLARREQLREDALVHRNAALADQGRRDPLTGLFNRRHFEDWAADYGSNALARERPMLIVLIDVDHFKQVNDTHGHAVGDEVLVGLAARLKEAIRPEDILVRWGGEEIVVAMAATRSGESIGRWLLHVIGSKPMRTSAGPLSVTASIGVARLPMRVGDYRVTVDRALILADRALYTAKNAGRNRAVCVESLTVQRTTQLAMVEENILHAAQLGLVELQVVLPSDLVGMGAAEALPV